MQLEYIILIAIVSIIILLIYNIITRKKNQQNEELIHTITDQLQANNRLSQEHVRFMSESFTTMQTQTANMQDKRLNELTQQLDQNQRMLYQTVRDSLGLIQKALNDSSLQNEQKLENIRITVEQRLMHMQEENAKKLDEMRHTVDEKLQRTLEDRLSKSFSMVSERLEQVYKGLGEMQTLAVGVGDLKKVLSNVKTRGILGEIQLGAILEEILSPEQYETNVITKKGSSNYVEFAVKLPADDNHSIYLPIDSKFPGETYANLVDAYEAGDTLAIAQCTKLLEAVIKQEAKDIKDKYIDIPNTTDFAIMFLPFEGLYAEVVKRGMVEILQRDYKVNIAGPTTMAALLNSLQMGFKTLAIQKRSSEVWDVLGAVKTEFDKFQDVLEGTQSKIEQAQKELDKLVGVRTRQIQRKLKDVSSAELTNSQTEIED